jgi:uncharacterized membrane protein
MSDPFRKLDQAEQKMRRAANAPKREMRGVQQDARRAANAPKHQARRFKNQALRPARQLQAQQRRLQSRGRRYKRYAGRLSGTDFMISALMYVTGVVSLFGGMVEDWDTQFIRYHMVNARVLWTTMLICTITVIGIPIALLLWFYSWYLGFRAYSGQYVRIPLLTGFAEGRGWLDIESEEEVQSGSF